MNRSKPSSVAQHIRDNPDVDVDLHGRAFEVIFGPGSEEAGAMEEMSRLEKNYNRHASVSRGDYVERDLNRNEYGTGMMTKIMKLFQCFSATSDNVEATITGNHTPSTPESTCTHRDCSICLLYTSPSPRDLSTSRMPSSA